VCIEKRYLQIFGWKFSITRANENHSVCHLHDHKIIKINRIESGCIRVSYKERTPRSVRDPEKWGERDPERFIERIRRIVES